LTNLDSGAVPRPEGVERPESAGADSGSSAPVASGASDAAESASADSRTPRLDLDDLASALVRLGIPAERSRRLVEKAHAALPTGTRTEAGVLRRALAGS